jgi:hypothetical protein
MREYRTAKKIPEPAAPQGRGRGGQGGQPARAGQAPREAPWIQAFRGGPQTYGSFLLAAPISDFINLAGVSLRLGGTRLLWDAANMKVTNVAEANKYLTREYRPGWELTGA